MSFPNRLDETLIDVINKKLDLDALRIYACPKGQLTRFSFRDDIKLTFHTHGYALEYKNMLVSHCERGSINFTKVQFNQNPVQACLKLLRKIMPEAYKPYGLHKSKGKFCFYEVRHSWIIGSLVTDLTPIHLIYIFKNDELKRVIKKERAS